MRKLLIAMLLLPASAYANTVTPQFTTGSMNSTTTTTQTITEVEQRQVFGAEVKTWNGSNITAAAKTGPAKQPLPTSSTPAIFFMLSNVNYIFKYYIIV